mmetsp:Transcript_50461/g.132927  ORF Transcript_50461/g.132927 Transcript_50461/m.132927 type:complete len:164 (+) Transcript_50461:56-547(+)
MSAADLKAKADVVCDREDQVLHKRCVDAAEKGKYSLDVDVRSGFESEAQIATFQRKFESAGFAVSVVQPSVFSSDIALRVAWDKVEDTEISESQGNLTGFCGVCHDEKLLRAVVPCGHTFCATCSTLSPLKTCPTCRGRIERSIPVFADKTGAEKASKRPRVA